MAFFPRFPFERLAALFRDFSSPGDAPALALRLEVERLRQAFGQTPFSLGATAVAALLAAFVLKDAVPLLWVGAWLGGMMLVCVGRFWLLRRFMQVESLSPQVAVWGRRFIVSTFWAGLSWGLSAMLLVPMVDRNYEVFIAFILAGIIAASNVTLAAYPRAAAAFTLPAVTPFICYTLAKGGEPSQAVAWMVALFGLMTTVIGFRNSRVVLESLRQRIEYGELVSDLFRSQSVLEQQVAERKRAEETALHSKGLLEQVFSGTHVMLAHLDAGFRYLQVNRPYAGALGHEPEFFAGKMHFDLYPDPETERIYRQVLETGEPYAVYGKAFERMEDEAGKGSVHLDWTLHALRGASGKSEGLLLSVIDVTERMRAEEAQRDSERNAHALLDATTETASLIDQDGTILAINQTGAERLRASPPELVGRNLFDSYPVDVARLRKTKMNEVVEAGEPVFFEDNMGGRRFRHAIYPIFGDKGGVVRFAAYSHDVTEHWQRQMIDELLSALDQRILKGEDVARMLSFICRAVGRLFAVPLVLVGEKEEDGSVSLRATAGTARKYLEELQAIGMRWDDHALGQGAVGKAIRTGEVRVFKTLEEPDHPWKEIAERHSIGAMLAIPLVVHGEVYGTFNLYAHKEDEFDDVPLVSHLKELSARLSIALGHLQDQQQLRLLGEALSAAGNSIFITDRAGRIQWVNKAFSRLSGYQPSEVIGETPRILNSGIHGVDYYRRFWETILAGRVWSSETVERRKNGSHFTVKQTVTPISLKDGEISHFISIHEDITLQKLTEERIQYMAHYDGLTDLPNRTLFLDRLGQAVARARRNNEKFALLFVDLDRFKLVNDSFGHHVGDRLLQVVATRLRNCLRDSDTVARLAGDEFTIILPDISGRQDAALVAEKVVASLSEQVQIDGETIDIGGSVGISIYPESGETEEDLLRFADKAMYEAKESEGSTYRFCAA